MAIFANRRTKNRNNFGKFDNGADLQPSSNFFPKFSLTSAPLSAVPNSRNSKTEKFSLHFFDLARPIFFQKGKENFLFWIFAKSKKAEAEQFIYIFSLFILLTASVPPSPTLATAWNSHILQES
jgi:hypothetical protein